jgi:pyridinium-3,5-bisthiocarboxylic acid mononucleotide nickel chelatase
MFLGALVDAGLPLEELRRHLELLPIDSFEIHATREKRKGITGTKITIEDKSRHHVPRNLEDIKGIIEKTTLDRTVKDKSIEIFETLAGVEARIHGHSIDEVHFHEVGATDSIIDIVGTVLGIKAFEIGTLFVSSLPLGSGFVQTDHGTIPLPSPATIALLKDVPVFGSGVSHEMVTPTGAALVKSLAASFGVIPPMVIENIGYGTGSRDLPDRPNLVRILIGNESHEDETDTVAMLETNIDDANPEWLGYLMDRLFESGALDVTFNPVQMKKNRPGINLRVLTRPALRDSLTDILLKESTAIGVRFSYYQRKILKRSQTEIDSPWGKILVKEIINTDGSPYFQPEYEACREIALKNKIALKEIYYWIMAQNKRR